MTSNLNKCACPKCYKWTAINSPTCSICQKRYHKLCTGIDYPIIPSNWICYKCTEGGSAEIYEISSPLMTQKNSKKSLLINTPGDSLMLVEKEVEDMVGSIELNNHKLEEGLEKKLEQFKTQLLVGLKEIINNELKTFRQELQNEDKNATNYLLAELNDIDKDNYEKQLNEIARLQNEIQMLLVNNELLLQEIKSLKAIARTNFSDEIHGNNLTGTTKNVPRIYSVKRKLCILSSNSRNLLLTNIEKVFNKDFEYCHYCISNCGVLKLLDGLQEKIIDFSYDDYCLIMIGEEDFITSKDYHTLVNQTRNILNQIKNTNLILCLPTFRYGYYSNLYNSRIEHFNQILYQDIVNHQYAYLIDSNQNLPYDYTVFSGYRGTINDKGSQIILTQARQVINYLEFDIEYSTYKLTINVTDKHTQTDQNDVEVVNGPTQQLFLV